MGNGANRSGCALDKGKNLEKDFCADAQIKEKRLDEGLEAGVVFMRLRMHITL